MFYEKVRSVRLFFTELQQYEKFENNETVAVHSPVFPIVNLNSTTLESKSRTFGRNVV